MTLYVAYAFVPQTDPEASIAFYRDVLGFEIRNDVGQGEMRWITVAPPGQDTAIVLHPPAVDPGITEQERQVVLEMIAKGSSIAVTLATDDLDGLFERVQGSGADIVQEPMDQPYGVRDAAFRDPTGNLIRANDVA